MKPKLKQIYVLEEASDLLDKVDTSTPKYMLASQIIIASIKQRKS